MQTAECERDRQWRGRCSLRRLPAAPSGGERSRGSAGGPGLLGICALGIVLGLGCQGDEDRSVERPSEDGEFTLQVENVERVTDVPDAVGFAPPSGTTSYASIDLSIMNSSNEAIDLLRDADTLRAFDTRGDPLGWSSITRGRSPAPWDASSCVGSGCTWSWKEIRNRGNSCSALLPRWSR